MCVFFEVGCVGSGRVSADNLHQRVHGSLGSKATGELTALAKLPDDLWDEGSSFSPPACVDGTRAKRMHNTGHEGCKAKHHANVSKCVVCSNIGCCEQ